MFHRYNWRRGDNHPPPGPNPTQQFLHRQHDPPRTVPGSRHYTFKEFFGHEPPFKFHHAQLFARLEGNWLITQLPLKVMDRGGLRLYVWNQSIPNPETHFEESAKRLPLIREAPDFKAFFLQFCRAQHDPPSGHRTGRCPLCSSQLFGFKIADHCRTHCPLDPLNLEQRLEWVAINFLAYCNQCHSRSAKHFKDEHCTKTRKTCELCEEMGHSSIQKMCNTEIGKHPDQQLVKVNEYRRKHLERIKQLMSDKDTALRYQLPSDSTYVPEISSRTPVEQRCGYHVLCEGQHEFPQMALTRYKNFGTPHNALYHSLVPPEYNAQAQLAIPNFDPMTEAYLEEYGRCLTEFRAHGDRGIRWPTYPLQEPVDPEDATLEDVHFPDVPPPRAPTPPPLPPPTLLHAIPTAAEIDWQAENFHGYVRPPPTQAELQAQRAAQQEQLDLELATALARVEAQFEAERQQGAYSNLRGPQSPRNRPTQSTSAPEVPANDRTTYAAAMRISRARRHEPPERTDPSQSSDRLLENEDLTPATKERILGEEALALCQEVAKVDRKPARSGFQHLAYNSIRTHRLPQDHSAMIVRIQTLQYILTGTRDPDLSVYANLDLIEDLTPYAYDLTRYCNRMAVVHFIYVQLETKSATKIRNKADITRGSDVLYIPGIQVWRAHGIRDLMNQICGGIIDRFATTTHYWYTPPPLEKLPRAFQVEEEEQIQPRFEAIQRPFGQHPYFFIPDDLQQWLELTVPDTTDALILRILWTTRYITGQDYPEEITNSARALLTLRLPEYYTLIRSAVSLLHELADNALTVDVKMTKCPVTIATEAARGRNIVLPTFTLFASHPVNRWTVFANLAWNQLYHDTLGTTRREEGCQCANPKMQEVMRHL